MSKNKGDLDTRMKCYEYVTRTYLTRRTPAIIRLDGKAFHTFTKGFSKPFDDIMVQTMQDTMKFLCDNIEGCVLGYTQSDEITLILIDYKKLTTEAWFSYNIQKMCSIASSMATLAFNLYYRYNVSTMCKSTLENSPYSTKKILIGEGIDGCDYKLALFDARVFNVPKEEVNNCLLWRQQDATRNSVEALAQSLYPQRELEHISTKKLQDKMFTEKGVNWNDLPTHLKRGSCCVKQKINKPIPGTDEMVERSQWVVDLNIPIFSQNVNYVNDRITFVERPEVTDEVIIV